MTKKQFKQDFLRGLGSALIELQSSNDPKKYEEIVIYGCLHNTTYDMQCEGDRGWYLYYAAVLAECEETVENAIIQRYFHIGDADNLFIQYSSILYHFAINGSEAARISLYKQYEIMINELSPRKIKRSRIYPRRDMFDWLCVWLTSLDGWSSFKKIVCEVSETLLPKNVDMFFSEWFYDNSKEKFGTKRIDNFLQKQAERSPFIETYYEKAKEWDRHIFTDDRPILTLEQLLIEIEEYGSYGRGLAMQFARNATTEELGMLAQAVMDEPNISKKVKLLWPFRIINNFVFPEEYLSELLKIDDERLRFLAIKIMGKNPSPEARELALMLIRSGKDIENGLTLLSKHFRSEDEELLYAAVKSFPVRYTEYSWHSAYIAARDCMESKHGKPKTDILEYLYRNTLCGSCRESIVRIMQKKRILTETILKECQFDSNDEIREYVEKIIKRNNRLRD